MDSSVASIPLAATLGGSEPAMRIASTLLQITRMGCALVYPGAPDVKHKTPTDYLIATLKAQTPPG